MRSCVAIYFRKRHHFPASHISFYSDLKTSICIWWSLECFFQSHSSYGLAIFSVSMYHFQFKIRKIPCACIWRSFSWIVLGSRQSGMCSLNCSFELWPRVYSLSCTYAQPKKPRFSNQLIMRKRARSRTAVATAHRIPKSNSQNVSAKVNKF